ncbi:ABC transporter substrate-binding protein [Nocardioides sp. TF02-7]|uniref:ABC transporter substrate-binding protein n=1 Tax=Nocardioides sp. TF02-7 TaxID=2917724 RepID=UPI001F05427D|nr:ABC transporter substrate-binding protein [Nocardioides sp. TF02-7]UMG93710.1 ABC transporter substrate-binding protein [Nocardioides sp. TF02-7]
MGVATATLTAAALLAACGGNDSGGGSGSDTTLTVAWSSTPTQMDPNEFTGLTWVYALDAAMGTLLEYDTTVSEDELVGTDDIVPALAESWEEDEGGTSYTITLRKGVESPYGNEMTADDVVYSFERMYSNPASLQAAILLKTANVDPEKPVEKIDDYTIRYNLTAPSALAMSVLAYPLVGILDSTEVEKHATDADPWAAEWLAKNTASFGAYQLESLDPGTEVRFTANENYYGERSFDDIVIRAVPEGSSRVQLLASGEVDMISEPPIDQLDTINDSDNAVVSQMPDTNRHNFTVSEKSKVLADPLVRQALNYAINRQGIVDSIYHGYAEPATNPVASSLWEDQPTVAEHDPERAKDLLAEAGYADGFTMQLAYNSERPGPFAENLARLIQSDLAEVGIEVETQAVPSNTDFEAGVAEQKYEAYLYTERPALPEIGYTLFLYLHSESALNSSGYDNPEFDKLAEQVLVTPAGEERQGIIGDALDVLAENNPLVSLVEIPDLVGIAESIEGYHALPTGGWAFQDLSRK